MAEKFTIIADSCCNLYAKDLTSEKIDFHVVPLTLTVGDREFIDDEKLNKADFVKVMNASKICAKSACPSPEAFFDVMSKGENVLVLTLSSKLSGTYASAMTAAKTVKEKFPDKKLAVIDTLSAAAGSDLILYRVRDYIENNNCTFDELTVKAQEISSTTRVRFLLQDIGNLVKNGRMSALLGKVLSTARIKLICGENGQGEIRKFGMSLGTKRGLQALAEIPAKERTQDKPIHISHVFNQSDADFLKDLFVNKHGFKNISVNTTRGVSSLYAADKGIMVAY